MADTDLLKLEARQDAILREVAELSLEIARVSRELREMKAKEQASPAKQQTEVWEFARSAWEQATGSNQQRWVNVANAVKQELIARGEVLPKAEVTVTDAMLDEAYALWQRCRNRDDRESLRPVLERFAVRRGEPTLPDDARARLIEVLNG